MIIRKIRMVNFRGFSEKTIDFQDSPVVLLSAANGFGKTTTVDAIEWCLTGNIGRLKTSFDTRSTNDGERKKNAAGILKNRDAGKNAKVKVELSLFDGEKEIILCREQRKDELDPTASKVSINKDRDAAEKFIREYIGDSFYNFHFCDIQKSFNVQSKKRKDLKDFFGAFITNYDEKIQIAKNLEIFAEDVSRYIEDKTVRKEPKEKIALLEEQLAKASETSVQVPYPGIVFYPGEQTEITGLNKAALLAQKEAVENCGYQTALEGLEKLLANENLKRQQVAARNILSFWETRGESIRHAVSAGFPKNTAAITAREQKLRKLNSLVLSQDTILRDAESVIALRNDGFTQSDFDAVKKAIEENGVIVKNLSSEIDLLSKNNKMLKLLSSLAVKKQVVIDYRNAAVEAHGAVRCPVCGSESFAVMDEASVLKEAGEYIRQNGAAVQKRTNAMTSLQEQIQDLYQKLIQRAKIVVDEEKQKLAAQISDLMVLKDEVQPYFDVVEELQKTGKTISAEELTAEKAAELLAGIEAALLPDSTIQEMMGRAHQILTVLGYKFEDETVKQTYEKVRNRISGFYEITDFSYDLLVSKINSIDNILANQTLMDLAQQLEACHKKNRDLDAEIEKLQKLHDQALQRAADIKDVVNRLSMDEYERVGPALNKYYNKLARLNADSGIRVKLENEGISLVDNNDKNIVNVLSNGQISVFLLAYFFAGINARIKQEKMKVYFIDDLTACMDDVNMLAFMDILKYQMSSKETMEQLFFITCDDRISKLLKYKLKGRGIELRELKEEDFL